MLSRSNASPIEGKAAEAGGYSSRFVPEEKIFRPAVRNAFGMDKEGADYRACATYGSQFGKSR